VDTDPDLAWIRRLLVDEFGEETAYDILLSPEGTATTNTQTWNPLPSHEALAHWIGGRRSVAALA
jgi:hypothetical protein